MAIQVNCTTIDFFHPWPEDALTEVATKFLEETKLGGEGEDSEGQKAKVARVFAAAHQEVTVSSSRMLFELKRHNYVTPTNYLELVKSYREPVGLQIGAPATFKSYEDFFSKKMRKKI